MTNPIRTDGGRDRKQASRTDQLTHEIDDELPSEAVIKAVAALTNTPPLELDPLYQVIDPEQLNEVIRQHADSTVQATLSFEFGGCTVTVNKNEIKVNVIEDAD